METTLPKKVLTANAGQSQSHGSVSGRKNNPLLPEGGDYFAILSESKRAFITASGISFAGFVPPETSIVKIWEFFNCILYAVEWMTEPEHIRAITGIFVFPSVVSSLVHIPPSSSFLFRTRVPLITVNVSSVVLS